MPDVRTLSLEEIYRCSADIRGIGKETSDGDEAARRIVSYLFDRLRSSDSDAPACPLVRFFRSRSLSTLAPDDAARVRQSLNGPSSGDLCLSLRASRGVEREWNDPSMSRGHRLLPLASPEAIAHMPMASALVAQLGIATKELPRPCDAESSMQLFDVFHVEQARGSPFVPEQASFVGPYGISSVLGVGGRLRPDDIFVVLLFSTATISPAVAQRFRALAPSIGIALLSSERRRTSCEARVCGYELIVCHHEAMALKQNRELGRVASELASSLRERERLLVSAEEARAEAEAASGAKDAFLATLGHELRNPLSPILTAVELMKLHGGRSREQEVIERQATHLARLVDDLLDVARIVRGKIEITKGPVEVAAFVEPPRQRVQVQRSRNRDRRLRRALRRSRADLRSRSGRRHPRRDARPDLRLVRPAPLERRRWPSGRRRGRGARSRAHDRAEVRRAP